MTHTEEQRQPIGQLDRSWLFESHKAEVIEGVQRVLRQMEDEAKEKAAELRRHYPQLSQNQARRLVHSREWPEEHIATCLYSFATHQRAEDWRDLLTLLSVVYERLNSSLLSELVARYHVQNVWQDAQHELIIKQSNCRSVAD